MLCVGTSVICYSFDIRASKFEIRNPRIASQRNNRRKTDEKKGNEKES